MPCGWGDAVRLIEELVENRENSLDYVVLTGDGRTDAEILKALCGKYDGRKTIWYPKPPVKERKTGVGIFKASKIYAEKYKLTRFLVLIDREHFFEIIKGRRKDRRKRDEPKIIRDYLKNTLNMRIEQMTELTCKSAWLITGKHGSHGMRIYIVIMGKKKAMEEELVRLILLESSNLNLDAQENKNLMVGADNISSAQDLNELKKMIRKILGKRFDDNGIDKLIGGAQRNNLEQAFPGLTGTLIEIENEK